MSKFAAADFVPIDRCNLILFYSQLETAVETKRLLPRKHDTDTNK